MGNRIKRWSPLGDWSEIPHLTCGRARTQTSVPQPWHLLWGYATSFCSFNHFHLGGLHDTPFCNGISSLSVPSPLSDPNPLPMNPRYSLHNNISL